MPIYEYQCSKCSKIIEKIYLSNVDIQHVICSCNNVAHKIISKSSFHLSGSGWSSEGYQKRDSAVDNPLM